MTTFNEKQQKGKARVAKMQAGKLAKKQAREKEDTLKEKLINDQAAQIEALKAKISDKNVENTTEFVKTGQVDMGVQAEVDKLKQDLDDMKIVLSHQGALPKRVDSTQPWKSIGKPFHKDIYKVKKTHDGFELGFIEECDLDSYLSDGYTVARGDSYGEKEGSLIRKGMIGVEQPIEAADADRARLRAFNLAQRTSALQKTKDMSEAISHASGRKAKLELGYEIHK